MYEIRDDTCDKLFASRDACDKSRDMCDKSREMYDKSLTSRNHRPPTRLPSHSTSHLPASTFDLYSDPYLFDSYLLSRLQFEEFLRSRSDLYAHMIGDPVRSHSAKSDSVAIPNGQIEKPFKPTSYSASPNFENRRLLRRTYDSTTHERLRNHQFSENSSLETGVTYKSGRYFASPKELVNSLSLTDLDDLIESCILPDPHETDGKRFQNKIDSNQMLLGGVLSLPHASTYNPLDYRDSPKGKEKSKKQVSNDALSDGKKKSKFFGGKNKKKAQMSKEGVS